MHPVLRNIRSLSIYIAVWVLLGLALLLLISPHPLSWAQGLTIVVPLCILYAFVCLSGLYLCRTFPLVTGRLRKSWFSHIAYALVGAALCLIVVKAVASAAAIPPARANAAMPVVFCFGIVLSLLSSALHSVFLSLQAKESAERRAAEAMLLASQAELRALRSQINPHFLYNSLNSISALTSIDARRAREMCIQLSEFLRTTLGLSERERVPLSFELDLARRYLAIEKTRFGARLNIKEDIEPGCLDDKIPALILQPLIENAVIHGIAASSEPGVLRLQAHCNGAAALQIAIENSIDTDAPPTSRTGFGLRNVRKRLETEYGSQATMTISKVDDLFRAELVLPRIGENV